MRVQQNWNEHDDVAEQDRQQRLPPTHAERDEPAREHVGRNAMRHRDPQRGEVVGGPCATRERRGRKIAVEERARGNVCGELGERFASEMWIVQNGTSAVKVGNCAVIR